MIFRAWAFLIQWHHLFCYTKLWDIWPKCHTFAITASFRIPRKVYGEKFFPTFRPKKYIYLYVSFFTLELQVAFSSLELCRDIFLWTMACEIPLQSGVNITFFWLNRWIWYFGVMFMVISGHFQDTWRFLFVVLGGLPRFGLLKKQRHQRDANLHNWMIHKRKFEIPKEPIFV
jgi:hypothetical protein